jgi:hypothetical protein
LRKKNRELLTPRFKVGHVSKIFDLVPFLWVNFKIQYHEKSDRRREN